MKMAKLVVVLSSLSISSLAFADAPVIDLSQTVQTSQVAAATPTFAPAPTTLPDTSSLPLDQRVGRLEQQMANFTQMNTPSRIDQLQQQVNQLQGKLEEQAHELQTMQTQQKSFYQDLAQQINQLKSAPNTLATTATVSPVTEQASYQKAFSLLAAKKYPESSSSFQSYLQQYPNGQFAANAHYWLGEIYFLQNKMDLANNEFQTIVDKYPKDQKVPDALLKLAFIIDHNGRHDEARQKLKEIVQRYPGTPAAQLADLRLKS